MLNSMYVVCMGIRCVIYKIQIYVADCVKG